MKVNQLPILLVASMLSAIPLTAVAQSDTRSAAETYAKITQKNIVGIVRDIDGEPLAGATVLIEGTKEGVATDIDGNFSILTKQKNPVLLISYIGMETARIVLPTKHNLLDITLQPVENMMDEVVVTGYQNIKRENATGSYQKLTAADLEKRHASDLVSNLEGSIPGLVRTRSYNGVKEGEDQLLIRGAGTFNASTAPLVVVDGLPIEGGMNSVNPYDVENVTVLKDASAAAIYGARAANGVIVITTKQAKKERLTIDFNADLTISEKQKYDNMGWATAAEVIQLERNNWNAMLDEQPYQSSLNGVLQDMDVNRYENISPVTRLLAANYKGELSDEELNATLDRWSRNDYRKEYTDLRTRTHVNQQYNLSLRTQGKALTSSIVVNYMTDNNGTVKENNNSLTFRYKGDLKVTPWMDLSFSVNVLNNQSKRHSYDSYGQINSFLPYQSMYNEDGSLSRMEGGVYLGNPAFSNSEIGLKDHSYNAVEETGLNMEKYRNTNIRTYVQALFKILPGWTAQGMFQYEDIYSHTKTHYAKDSYFMRNIYNLYTEGGTSTVWEDMDYNEWIGAVMNGETWVDFNHWAQRPVTVNKPTVHHVPDGGALVTNTREGNYYTFRAQTAFNREFGRHAVDAIAGFEYRQTHTTGETNTLLGYDDQSLTNGNLAADWAFINGQGNVGALGSDHSASGCPKDFSSLDVLHRFYSLYANAVYVYDGRYSVSGSYRVDKCDLFGADPKFRGRPLWSAGVSWNIHNEAFMHDLTWIDALKLRASYGLTGNINSSISSYLTARLRNNKYNNDLYATLKTPPNDQLRWEKTATWNGGVDFAFFGYRLNGSVDLYKKSGSDILTRTELDVTTGWTDLYINNGNMENKGVEIMLNGRILTARRRKDVGLNVTFNVAYNQNKVTGIAKTPRTGNEYRTSSLHLGYPINSLFGINYAGLQEKDGITYGTWTDSEGNVNTSSITSSSFKIEDCVYAGSLDPKWVGGITPEITWNGFSLSAMFNFYAGHVMQVNGDRWNTFCGGAGGYTAGGFPILSSALDYWNGVEGAVPNGFKSSYLRNADIGMYDVATVQHADYLKLRTLVLSYSFDRKICNKLRLNDIRLRVQMNDVWTWARNGMSLDPEAVNPSTGMNQLKTPRSYTMGLYINL